VLETKEPAPNIRALWCDNQPCVNYELSPDTERRLQCGRPVLRHWLRGRNPIYSKRRESKTELIGEIQARRRNLQNYLQRIDRPLPQPATPPRFAFDYLPRFFSTQSNSTLPIGNGTSSSPSSSSSFQPEQHVFNVFIYIFAYVCVCVQFVYVCIWSFFATLGGQLKNQMQIMMR